MIINIDSLQHQLMTAIEAQGELGMTEPRVTHAASIQDALLAGAAETVELFVAPTDPAKYGNRLNRIGAAIDALVIPSNISDFELRQVGGTPFRETIREVKSSGTPWGITIGVRRYVEVMGRAQLTTVDASEAVDLQRELLLRIFPNTRLAYAASQGEDLSFIGHFRRLRAQSDIRRFGNAAVTRL